MTRGQLIVGGILLIITAACLSIAKADAPVEDLTQQDGSAITTAQPEALNNVDNATVAPTTPTATPSPSLRSLPIAQRVERLEQQTVNTTQMNLPGKIDDVHQTIQELRGQLQEQQHQLQLLTEQQNKFYKDLDQRLTALSSGSKNSAENSVADNQNVAADKSSPVAKTPDNSIDKNKDQAAYQAATKLLGIKQYDKATASFKNYLTDFPQGQYAANTHYWLGEIYYLQGNKKQAMQSFKTVVYKYPDNAKAPDALLKLATMHLEMDNQQLATAELQKIQKRYPESGAAKSAKVKLQALNKNAPSHDAGEKLQHNKHKQIVDSSVPLPPRAIED